MHSALIIDLLKFEVHLLKGICLTGDDQERLDIDFICRRAEEVARLANVPAFIELVTAMVERGARCGLDRSDVITLANAVHKAAEELESNPNPQSFYPVNGC